MTANLTIGALLEQGVRTLQSTGMDVADATLDAEVLLADALRTSRTQIRTHPENAPGAERATRYAQLVARRVAGEPVAYILGYRDFWTLRLAVSPAVLVPRPETELLVEAALALLPADRARLVDLGTGSGAIALALASERPGWEVTATDISPEALAVARSNATNLQIERIEFVLGRWLQPLAGRRFDLITSNPPYIAAGDPALQQAPLKHEPQLALAAGTDGLACLREIIQMAPHHLQRGAWILLEHGWDQASAVARELVVRGFGHVRSHRDLAGHERVTAGQWN